MKRKPKSRRAILVSFVAACVSAIVAALELHGNHRYIMLAIDAVIIPVAGAYIRRRLRRMATDDSQALVE